MSSDGKCQLGTACVFSQSIPDVSDEGFARRIVGFEHRASQRRTRHVTQHKSLDRRKADRPVPLLNCNVLKAGGANESSNSSALDNPNGARMIAAAA
jgi:hypothetical protein